MTVRIYPVFEKFAPATHIEGTLVPLTVEHVRRWDSREALEAALARRGYKQQEDGTWEYGKPAKGKRGRPVRFTLEQQAQIRFEKERH